jgi:ATP-dependent helicase HrpA
VLRDGEVDLRLFRKQEEARDYSPAAVRLLAENALGKDIAWLQQELRSLASSAGTAPKPANFQVALSQLSLATAAKTAPKVSNTSAAPLAEQAREHILAHALKLTPVLPLTEARFRALCDAARKEFPALAFRVRELLKQIEELRAKIMADKKRYAGMENDVQRLVPPDLLACTPYAQLQHVSRYLRAIQVRAERAVLSPAKDDSKVTQIEDFDGWEEQVSEGSRETFRWMLEEYRVSVFAPELGTAQKVSAKRLEELWG